MTDIILTKGAHDTRDDGMCAMEAVAWLAGEPHSDKPACACPVVAAFVRSINDRAPDDVRAWLVPLLPRIVGSKSTPVVELARVYVVADYACRQAAPIALDHAGLTERAAALRALAPVVDGVTARAAAEAAAWAADAATRAEDWDGALACIERMIDAT